jgi:hypothetical protein
MSSTSADSSLSVNHPDVPPPPYSEVIGRINDDGNALGTDASVAQDGRVNIRITQRSRRLSTLLERTLKYQTGLEDHAPPTAYIPPSLGGTPDQSPPPPLNVVIHVVGSRGKYFNPSLFHLANLSFQVMCSPLSRWARF